MPNPVVAIAGSAVVGAGASLIGGSKASKAAKNAAKEQTKATNAAIAAKVSNFSVIDLTGTGNNTLKLNLDNLFDKVYYNTLYRGFAAPGAARSVRVTLTSKFSASSQQRIKPEPPCCCAFPTP